MASIPITVLQYDDPLLCGFNEVIKGLTASPLKEQKRQPSRPWITWMKVGWCLRTLSAQQGYIMP